MLPQTNLIAAILPHYTASGDTTKIITTDGQTISTNLRLKSVLRRVAATHAVDLVHLRRNVGRATGRAIHQPLPLTPKAMLIPVKVRKPKIAGDTCTGYLNYYSVRDIHVRESDQRYSTVLLAGGAEVDILWSAKTVKLCMTSAKLASHEVSHSAVDLPEMRKLERKLIEVIYEILTAKAYD